MTTPISFTASVDLPDGRRIYISLDVPQDHPSAANDGDVLDHIEFAQIAAAHLLRTLRRHDHHRESRKDMRF